MLLHDGRLEADVSMVVALADPCGEVKGPGHRDPTKLPGDPIFGGEGRELRDVPGDPVKDPGIDAAHDAAIPQGILSSGRIELHSREHLGGDRGEIPECEGRLNPAAQRADSFQCGGIAVQIRRG
jgi:hypothetical protein